MNKLLKIDIISALGLEDLPIEKKTDLIMKMAEVVQKRIKLRVMKLLSEENIKEYCRLLDNDEIRSEEFLTKKIPNYSSIIEEEIVRFKQEIA